MTNIDPRDFNRAFEGLDYPTSKDAVLRTAADKGGLNGDVQEVLALIPDRTYDSREDLEAAVTDAYVQYEGLTKGMPVTPAA